MAKITGNNTNETFTAQNGVSYNGQGGLDTLVFTGTYATYDIELKDTGNIKTDVTWSGGALDTKWIERFVFSDGVFDVTTGQFTANPPPAPTISISNGQAVEGQAVNFTISLSHATDHDVTVTYFTQAGTATGMGNDYIGTAGTTVTILAGQTSAQVSIQTINDPNVEPDEQFTVNLTNPVGGTIADGQGVGTILNNDVAPPHITMTAATSAVVEGGTIQYVFTRTGGDLSSAFSFNWDYNPPLPRGAATPGVDFIEPATKTITFAAGQTVATLDFVTIADGVYEGPLVGPSTEAFAITFVPSPTYTFTVVSNIATIVDGDLPPPPPPTISISDGSATEGQAVNFTISLSHATDHDVTVTYATQGGTAAGMGNDFFGTAGTAVTIAGGPDQRADLDQYAPGRGRGAERDLLRQPVESCRRVDRGWPGRRHDRERRLSRLRTSPCWRPPVRSWKAARSSTSSRGVAATSAAPSASTGTTTRRYLSAPRHRASTSSSRPPRRSRSRRARRRHARLRHHRGRRVRGPALRTVNRGVRHHVRAEPHLHLHRGVEHRDHRRR